MSYPGTIYIHCTLVRCSKNKPPAVLFYPLLRLSRPDSWLVVGHTQVSLAPSGAWMEEETHAVATDTIA